MTEKTSQPYNLRASAKKIGQLVPVIKAADGSTVDGTHREKVDPKWPSVTISSLDTVDKIAIAKIALNVQRRTASDQEKQEWLDTIATEYAKKDSRLTTLGAGRLALILSADTGMSQRWVYTYLSDKWKGKQGPKGPKIASPANSDDDSHAQGEEIAHARLLSRQKFPHAGSSSWDWTKTIQSLKARCENTDESLLVTPDEVDAILIMAGK